MRLSLKTTPQRRWTATLTRAAARVGSAAGTAVTRLRGVAWAILQTSVAAALAWFIAHDLLGHAQPFFAPIAVAVCLSASNVLRGQRAVQMIFGVSLGIGIGVGVQALLGTGMFALGVAVLVALGLAVIVAQGFIAQGLMFFNQTVAPAPSGSSTRWSAAASPWWSASCCFPPTRSPCFAGPSTPRCRRCPARSPSWNGSSASTAAKGSTRGGP